MLSVFLIKPPPRNVNPYLQKCFIILPWSCHLMNSFFFTFFFVSSNQTPSVLQSTVYPKLLKYLKVCGCVNRTFGFQPFVHNTSFTFLEDQDFIFLILFKKVCPAWPLALALALLILRHHKAWQGTRVRSFLDNDICPPWPAVRPWIFASFLLRMNSELCAFSSASLLQRKTGLNRVFGVHVIHACAVKKKWPWLRPRGGCPFQFFFEFMWLHNEQFTLSRSKWCTNTYHRVLL